MGVSVTRRFLRCAVLALAAAVLPVSARAQTAPEPAAGDQIERWTLANGLRVVARATPGAGAVAITVGYRMGIDDDPPGRAGLAQLLGELSFTAPAGNQPERVPEEIDSQRPLGWSYPVLRHVTLLTEVASTDRFPVVLDQVAQRMRGVTVDAAVLAAARARVKRELAQQLFGQPTQVLSYQMREIAAGRSDAEIVRHASGSDLARLTVKEVQAELRRWHVPANAVLSLVGDFGGVDLRRLVEQRFGAIPGGEPRPEPTPAPLKPVTRSMRRAGDAIGSIGVIAPAVSDTSHPYFYLASMVLGSLAEEAWNAKAPQAGSRFQFALVDEPELFRLFPPVPKTETDPGRLVYLLRVQANELPLLMIPGDSFDRLRSSMVTRLGGPMPAGQFAALGGNPGVLHSLARGQAACELRMGPAFWERYRQVLVRIHPSYVQRWREWFDTPRNQVVLLMAPRPR